MNGQVQRSVLDNGIRVLTEYMGHVRSATIGFWIDVGSRDEQEPERGISHFIEHMMFKGTERRSARDIAERIDAIGGQLNAFTAKEHTCYYARVLDEHVDEAMDLIAEMLLDSRLDPADIEKEKGVILEEIRLYEDTPDELVHELAAQAALDGHPGARSVLGTQESVAAFTREQIQEFLLRYYTGARLVVSAAGRVDHDRIVAAVARRFGGVVAGSRPQRRHEGSPAASRRLVRAKDTEQVHLCLGTPGLPVGHPEKWSLLVLDTIMGGGVSSRLFQELREERGWVYSTYSYHTALTDAGFFTVYAGMSPDRAEQVTELVHHELLSIADRGVTGDELARAKEHLKGSMMLGLESTSQRMSRLARVELAGERLLTPDEVLAQVAAVTREQLQTLARRLFVPSGFSLAAVGPTGWGEQLRLPSQAMASAG